MPFDWLPFCSPHCYGTAISAAVAFATHYYPFLDKLPHPYIRPIILLKSRGVISNTLELLGLIDKPISLMYSDIATFTGLTYTLLPFMILPLYVSIEKLDHKLIDAAKDLGAGSLRAFWHITLPLTMPGIVAGCMLVFLPSLGAFYIPEILGGAKSMLIGNFIKNQFLVARDWPLGAAASSILTLILLLLIAIYRFTSRGAARQPR